LKLISVIYFKYASHNTKVLNEKVDPIKPKMFNFNTLKHNNFHRNIIEIHLNGEFNIHGRGYLQNLELYVQQIKIDIKMFAK
jgi:hypothetical protein